jgi:hypothetical protein
MDFDNHMLQYTHIFAYRADINERFGPCEAPIDISPGKAPKFNQPIPQKMFKPDTQLQSIIEKFLIIIILLYIIVNCLI